MLDIFKTVEALNPSKDANAYWLAVNKTMLRFDDSVSELWKHEKQATVESIKISKEIALTHLAAEREKIMKLSHEEALKQLVSMHKIDSRMAVISAVSDNSLMSFT